MKRQILRQHSGAALVLAVTLGLWPGAATPLDSVDLTIASQDADLIAQIKSASLLWARRNETDAAAVDVFAGHSEPPTELRQMGCERSPLVEAR